MNIIKILDTTYLDKHMSAIHSLKGIGNGSAGEFFEFVVLNAIEHWIDVTGSNGAVYHTGASIPHKFKGLVDSKSDIVLHHATGIQGISLKTSSTHQSKIYDGSTKGIFDIHLTYSDIGYNLDQKIELGNLVADKLGDLPTLCATFDNESWFIQLKDQTTNINNLRAGNFCIKNNANSIALRFDEGGYIRAQRDGRIWADHNSFSIRDEISGELMPVDPHQLMRNLLNHINEF